MARRQLLRASLSLPIAWTILLASCGGAQPVGSVKQRGTKPVAPWAFGDEAADPTTAMILGTGPTGPTGATGATGAMSTVLEVRPQGRATVEVAGAHGVQRLELVATARGMPLPGGAGPTGTAPIGG